MTFSDLGRDLRYAARALARNPLFTIVAMLTLAIGTAANTAVFTVVDNVLLKPLPYPDSERLVSIWHDAPGAPGLTAVAGGLNLSPSMFLTYRDDNQSFSSIGFYSMGTASITGLAEPAPGPADVAADIRVVQREELRGHGVEVPQRELAVEQHDAQLQAIEHLLEIERREA